MKKLKSLKTLSSLGAVAAITPIVATACNDSDTANAYKTNVNSFYWSSDGDYLNKMSDNEIIEVFKTNNVAGQNGLPKNIYSNITLIANRVNNDWVSITINANFNSDHYKGTRTINIDAKTNLADLNWKSNGDVAYYRAYGLVSIKEAFILNNPAGVNNLPEDIYDNVEVKPTYDFGDWIINVVPKSYSVKYIGTATIEINTVKQSLETINWSDQDNSVNYFATMSAEEIESTFKLNNPEGVNGIPESIYDYVDVKAKGDLGEANWIINITAKDNNPYYQGSFQVIPIVCGYMDFNGQTYALSENTDINYFSSNTDGDWVIPVITNQLIKITKSERSKLTKLCVPSTANIAAINDNCLSGCSSLSFLDLGYEEQSGYNAASSIGNNFLSGCSSLSNINLSFFKSVQQIGGQFLNGCSSLSNINLSFFESVQQIGEHFLDGCSQLTGAVDLSTWTDVETFGSYFLYNCSKIEKIILNNSTKLTTWNTNFMNKCSACKEFVLSNLYSLKALDQETFLQDCPAIETLDLHNALSLGSIFTNFFTNRSNLKTVDLAIDEDLASKATLSIINPNFLQGCNNLLNVDISNQTLITTIGDNFLYNCTNVGKKGAEGQQDGYVRLDNLSSLTKIGNYFISCDGGKQMAVNSLDLTGMTSLEEIGEYFLRYCKKLTSLTLGGKTNGMINLKIIKVGFLSQCEALPSADLSSFISVETIGNYFMDEMKSITEVNLSAMIKLTKIGQYFLQNDTNLATLYVPNQNPITDVGSNFLSGCNNIAKIYVPWSEGSALLNAYKATSPWKDSGRDQKMEEAQQLWRS